MHGNYRIHRRCIRVHGKDEAGSGLLAAGRLVRVQLFACVIGAKRLGGVAGSLGLMLDMEDGRSVSQPLLCSFFFLSRSRLLGAGGKKSSEPDFPVSAGLSRWQHPGIM